MSRESSELGKSIHNVTSKEILSCSITLPTEIAHHPAIVNKDKHGNERMLKENTTEEETNKTTNKISQSQRNLRQKPDKEKISRIKNPYQAADRALMLPIMITRHAPIPKKILNKRPKRKK